MTGVATPQDYFEACEGCGEFLQTGGYITHMDNYVVDVNGKYWHRKCYNDNITGSTQ